ncbi:MAG: hypothetical protein DYH08_06830 [Actinobacteria bacterium ATB1]|nr:hypothetical protein [Actinobacteria bacterium ATB1]
MDVELLRHLVVGEQRIRVRVETAALRPGQVEDDVDRDGSDRADEVENLVLVRLGTDGAGDDFGAGGLREEEPEEVVEVEGVRADLTNFRISSRSAAYPSQRSYGRAQNSCIGTSFTTSLKRAVEASRALRNHSFCVAPSIVRLGSFSALRHVASTYHFRGARARPKIARIQLGAVGARSGSPEMGLTHAPGSEGSSMTWADR